MQFIRIVQCTRLQTWHIAILCYILFIFFFFCIFLWCIFSQCNSRHGWIFCFGVAHAWHKFWISNSCMQKLHLSLSDSHTSTNRVLVSLTRCGLENGEMIGPMCFVHSCCGYCTVSRCSDHLHYHHRFANYAEHYLPSCSDVLICMSAFFYTEYFNVVKLKIRSNQIWSSLRATSN